MEKEKTIIFIVIVWNVNDIKIYETFNIHHNKWFFIFDSHNSNIVLFPVFIWKKMPKQIKIKYFEESVFAKEAVKTTEGSAGYDLFTAEAKTIAPNSSQIVCLDLRWAIPKGFFGKVFPRSSLIKDHNVTVDAGVIDSDYRGLVYVLLCNHSKKAFTVRTGDRIAQAVFLEKFDVQFTKVNQKEDLGATNWGGGGFGSTGVTVVKKWKQMRKF